jgi:hypothetical protein
MPNPRRLYLAGIPQHITQCGNNRKGLPLDSELLETEVESQLQIELGTGKVGRPPSSK